MNIKFLGGAREVGRSAVLVKTRGGARILLDYGVKIDEQVNFPDHVAPKDLDAVILTHAHLDHSGAIPLLFISGTPRLYATESTYKQIDVLLRDMMKLNGYYLPFGDVEINKIIARGTRVDYGETISIKDAEIQLVNAGHIPGSAQVIINADKTLLYTGDFTTIKTRLVHGLDFPGKGYDVVITESTYAREDHIERGQLEQMLVQRVKETVQDGGVAVIPAFSVARSQEVACILFSLGYKGPMVLDGMATRMLSIYLSDKEYIDGYELLERAARRVRIIKGRRDREKVLQDSGAVISPAGMLKGGPAAFYASRVAEDPLSSIILVSFQSPDSPGARLLAERLLEINGRRIQVRAKVAQYRLSAHAGRRELHEYLSSVVDGSLVLTIHGEPDSCEELASWINDNTSGTARAVRRGDDVEL